MSRAVTITHSKLMLSYHRLTGHHCCIVESEQETTLETGHSAPRHSRTILESCGYDPRNYHYQYENTKKIFFYIDNLHNMSSQLQSVEFYLLNIILNRSIYNEIIKVLKLIIMCSPNLRSSKCDLCLIHGGLVTYFKQYIQTILFTK